MCTGDRSTVHVYTWGLTLTAVDPAVPLQSQCQGSYNGGKKVSHKDNSGQEVNCLLFFFLCYGYFAANWTLIEMSGPRAVSRA